MKDTTQQWLNFADADLRTCEKLLDDVFLTTVVADNLMLQKTDAIYTTSRYPADLGLMSDGKPAKELSVELYKFAKHIYENTIKTIDK